MNEPEKQAIESAVARIDNRNPGIESTISSVLNQGKIPLLVGRSGIGKSLLATRALGLPFDSGNKMLEVYWENNGKKLSKRDYFQPIENGKLLIDEINCYQQGDELDQVIAQVVSYDMKLL